MENWVPIPNWEGWYEVSDLGRIRSIDRVVKTGSYERHYKGKILTPGVHVKDKSRHVNLARGGPKQSFRVARLVLIAFVGPCPPGKEACHWDDDQDNNRLSNLRWGTKPENGLDRVRNNVRRRAESSRSLTRC